MRHQHARVGIEWASPLALAEVHWPVREAGAQRLEPGRWLADSHRRPRWWHDVSSQWANIAVNMWVILVKLITHILLPDIERNPTHSHAAGGALIAQAPGLVDVDAERRIVPAPE